MSRGDGIQNHTAITAMWSSSEAITNRYNGGVLRVTMGLLQDVFRGVSDGAGSSEFFSNSG
jgi:hypothetical protein